ncbi:MAG: hypothetical protein JJU01_05300 [Alkalibacterium sp.]|nr:hypothetical protein [Alkalibacterium sp.]TVP91710.1 MAG: hypothetical protein EA249_04600 [Alkalibacterium sp.]
MLLSGALVTAFVIIHFFSVYLRMPKSILRKFISFTAGVGVSYVFVHLWPQVAHAQSLAEESIPWLESHFLHYAFYIMALVGLAVFYSMDRLIARAYENEDKTDPNLVESKLFWSHMSFFALYNAMIGYLLFDREDSGSTLLIFFIAFSLHFITNDWGLRHHHEVVYDKYGRYILSLSILAGYALGVFSDFPEYAIGSVEAFVTGAMTLNVIKHELPSEREGNLEGFLIGLVSSGLLFIFI